MNNKVPIRVINDTIRVINDTIKLDSKKMEIGKYYPITYHGTNYFFCKSEEGIIDIYVEEE